MFAPTLESNPAAAPLVKDRLTLLRRFRVDENQFIRINSNHLNEWCSPFCEKKDRQKKTAVIPQKNKLVIPYIKYSKFTFGCQEKFLFNKNILILLNYIKKVQKRYKRQIPYSRCNRLLKNWQYQYLGAYLQQRKNIITVPCRALPRLHPLFCICAA